MNRQYSQRLPAKSDGSVRGSGRFHGALAMPGGRIPWGFCNSAAVPAAAPHGSALFFAAHHASATWLYASRQLCFHNAPSFETRAPSGPALCFTGCRKACSCAPCCVSRVVSFCSIEHRPASSAQRAGDAWRRKLRHIVVVGG